MQARKHQIQTAKFCRLYVHISLFGINVGHQGSTKLHHSDGTKEEKMERE